MEDKRVRHPGRILLEEWMEPYNLSQNELARGLGVPPRRVNEIVLGKRGITADTALRLARVFWRDARYWLVLQMEYDLDQAQRPIELRDVKPGPVRKRTRSERRMDAWRFLDPGAADD